MNKTSELRLANRMARLGTETAFEVLVKARALEAKGRDIVHLEIGEPDFDTPANIIGAATDALHKGFTHYGPSAGLPQLRETIAQYVSETRASECDARRSGRGSGREADHFLHASSRWRRKGTRSSIPNPGFPIYESMINYVGAKAVPIQLREEMDFRLDVDELEGLINDRTKLIILNSPQNPTGGVLDERGHRRHRARDRRSQHHGADGRDLQPPHFRGRASLDHVGRWNEGALHFAGRFLEDLCDDGLADGLRRDARGFGDACRAADDELQLLHGELHPDRRHRGVARAAGIGRDDVRGI